MRRTKLATTAVTGVLSLAVTGAAAFASIQPTDATSLFAGTDTGATARLSAEDKPKDGTKAVLDRFVANGTITQAQEDAILKAFREAAEQRKKDAAGDREAAAALKRVLADLMRLSIEYIDLPKEAVAGQLKAGKSLGEIADQRPGKSRQGLIEYDVQKVTAQLDKLVADGKITKERADRGKAHLTEQVAKFVDHKAVRTQAAPKEKKPAERGAKPTPTATPTT
jgi:ribosomal protein S20